MDKFKELDADQRLAATVPAFADAADRQAAEAREELVAIKLLALIIVEHIKNDRSEFLSGCCA